MAIPTPDNQTNLSLADHVADIRCLLRASGAAWTDDDIICFLQRALDEYSRCVPCVQNCVFVVAIDANNINLDSASAVVGACTISTPAIIGAEYQDRSPIENCQQIIFHHDARQLYFGPDVAFTQTQVNIRYRARWMIRRNSEGDFSEVDPYPQHHRGIVNRLAAAFALEAKHADTMGTIAQCVACDTETTTHQTGTTTTATTSDYGKVSTTTNDLEDKTVYNSDQTREDNLTAATTYGGVTTTDYGRTETMGGEDQTQSDFSEKLSRTNVTESVAGDNPPFVQHSIMPYSVKHEKHNNTFEIGWCCSSYVTNALGVSTSFPTPDIMMRGTDASGMYIGVTIPAVPVSGVVSLVGFDVTFPLPALSDDLKLNNTDIDEYPERPTAVDGTHFQETTLTKGKTTCTETIPTNGHQTSETQTTDYGRTTALGGTDVSTQSGGDFVHNTGTQTTQRRGDDTTTHTGTQATVTSGEDVVTSVTTPNLTTNVIDPNRNMMTLLMLADRYFQLWQKLWNDAWRDLQCICEPCKSMNQLQPSAQGYNAQQIFGRTT